MLGQPPPVVAQLAPPSSHAVTAVPDHMLLTVRVPDAWTLGRTLALNYRLASGEMRTAASVPVPPHAQPGALVQVRVLTEEGDRRQREHAQRQQQLALARREQAAERQRQLKRTWEREVWGVALEALFCVRDGVPSLAGLCTVAAARDASLPLHAAPAEVRRLVLGLRQAKPQYAAVVRERQEAARQLQRQQREEARQQREAARQHKEAARQAAAAARQAAEAARQAASPAARGAGGAVHRTDAAEAAAAPAAAPPRPSAVPPLRALSAVAVARAVAGGGGGGGAADAAARVARLEGAPAWARQLVGGLLADRPRLERQLAEQAPPPAPRAPEEEASQAATRVPPR